MLGNAAVYYPMLKDPKKFRLGFHMAGAGALPVNRMGSEVRFDLLSCCCTGAGNPGPCTHPDASRVTWWQDVIFCCRVLKANARPHVF